MPSQKELELLRRFRGPHHTIAKLLAAGMTPGLIRHTTGISQRRLNLYLADPAFQDLVLYFERQHHAGLDLAIDSYQGLMAWNRTMAEMMIAEEIEDAVETGERLPINTANKISMERADRTGFGKHSTVQHNHDFAALLDKAIERSGVTMIEGKAEAVPVLPSLEEGLVPTVNPPSAVGAPIPPAPTPPPRSFASVLKKRRIA